MRTYLLLTMIFFGCNSQGELNYEQYLKYVHNPHNGLVKTVESNGTSITCSYKPTDLLIRQETSGEELSPKLYDSLQRHFDRYYFFVISYSQNNEPFLNQFIDSPESYQRVVSYLSSDLSNDLVLKTNNGSQFRVFDFILSTSSGATRSSDVLIAFKPESAIQGDFNIELASSTITGLERCKFNFKASALKRIPRLRKLTSKSQINTHVHFF